VERGEMSTLIAIAVPCHVFVAPQMAYSLALMTADLGHHKIDFALRFFGNCSMIFGRNELTRWAYDIEATHLLWIDTDSVFPYNAARRLLAHKLPFVGANFARKIELRDSAVEDLDGNRLTPRESGLEAVKTIGCGFTLTQMRVFDAVEEPWWRAIDGSVEGPGEDTRFCEVAKEAGYIPFVDHGLSLECGHIGLYEFKLQDQTDTLRQIMDDQVQNVAAMMNYGGD
jgi:hypothetical protein